MKSNEYQRSSPSPMAASRSSSQVSKIDLRQSALDSKKMLASQLNQPFLDTISSNESRYTSSPNFLANASKTGGGMINVPKFRNQAPHFESLSFSGSSEFGQHSLRSSIEQQISYRGFNAEQIRLDQYQLKMHNPTILEESKEEDMSFNRTLGGQSPIQKRLEGTGINFENKSSIDDGTRSLLQQMRDNMSNDYSLPVGQSIGQISNLKNMQGSSNIRPNYNISTGNSQAYFNRMGKPTLTGSQRPFTSSKSNFNHDEELLHELGQKQPAEDLFLNQQQRMTSLEVSDDNQSAGDMQSTFKSITQIRNDPIRIDDNNFVTLSQVNEGPKTYGGVPPSGRPSNASAYGNAFNYYVGGGGLINHGASFSDASSSNPTTNMNTPYSNQYRSRMISPYGDPNGRVSSSQNSQRCQCCQGPIFTQSQMRPTSGLSQIETKNLNFNESSGEVQTPHLPSSEMEQSTKILSSQNQKSELYKPVICGDCQSKILQRDTTPIQSDLRVSQLSSNLQYKSQFSASNDENANINSNLSSLHQQYQNLHASNANHLKMTSSLLIQSDLVNSTSQQSSQPLQVNLLQNSSAMSNPVLQQSSLQYLSYLSDNVKSQARRENDNISLRYGVQNSDAYKLRLKDLMNRQFERSAKNDPTPISRMFRERQTKRAFDQLQNLKAGYAKTYEELESIHINLLLQK